MKSLRKNYSLTSVIRGITVVAAASLLAAPAATASPETNVADTVSAEASNSSNTQTIEYSDGTTVTGILDEEGETVDLYLNGEYTKTASLDELKSAAENSTTSDPNTIQPMSGCGHVLNGVAAANGMLWVAAGLSAGTANLPAAAVAGVAGVVTSGIIGVAGAEC